MGVGQIDLHGLIQNETLESLGKVQEDGRLTPGLAKGLTTSPDGLMLTVDLRPGVRFHDGSFANGAAIAASLRSKLPTFMGPTYSDVESIDASSDVQIVIRLRKPSQFVAESLEVQISKVGSDSVGTGPFLVSPVRPGELQANAEYYLGRPHIDRIVVETYPTVRAAWADLLRNNIDMLYEVGVDALDSLEAASTVNVFSFVRRYQYAIILNPRSDALRSAAIRRALNAAVDRDALIKDAFHGHAIASAGPVWPKNWAFSTRSPSFVFDPEYALKTLRTATGGKTLTFTCLATADEEHLALTVKQQLERFGVDMKVEESSLAQINKASSDRSFDAILAPILSGPTLFRPYLWWHSEAPFNRTGYANQDVDRALDLVRRARSDDEYRTGVEEFQRSVVADPPAIFLAWDELARAVSNRFEVPVEPGLDVVGALRLWRPVAGAARADKN